MPAAWHAGALPWCDVTASRVREHSVSSPLALCDPGCLVKVQETFAHTPHIRLHFGDELEIRDRSRRREARQDRGHEGKEGGQRHRSRRWPSRRNRKLDRWPRHQVADTDDAVKSTELGDPETHWVEVALVAFTQTLSVGVDPKEIQFAAVFLYAAGFGCTVRALLQGVLRFGRDAGYALPPRREWRAPARFSWTSAGSKSALA